MVVLGVAVDIYMVVVREKLTMCGSMLLNAVSVSELMCSRVW